MNSKRIDCFKCKYFYVTWDQRFPKGCKAFQFKTAKLPSMEVLKASGQPCLRFEKKEN
ncbi:uracil-DNA glycosylase [Bacillus sp. S/N-304-OC-R1]|uniref:uracil-DNA glycosylase n=1 Tax=Bacillus sp. S/N-304-OC-R1 TaxID=2758034 RepID=UPI001C8EF75B|nr:uracil-DNA glycosylase [Bacillus sp. S/N-304-OC-R1]MBY0123399.1 uracil-DNA glycosylase [Bacillus sp. S/N-304-OC-R1]